MDALDLPMLRKRKGLRQQDVASELGMSRLKYNVREQNPESFTLAEWKKLAVVLDFDPTNVNIKRYVPCDRCDGTGLLEERHV
jgi:transcriptional regulator with XRE-family HTH domain